MANSLIYGEPGKPSAPSAPDTRVWMYRGKEARLFSSIDEIPAGEDWREAPYEIEQAPDAPKRVRKKSADDVIEVAEKPDGDSN